MVTKDEYIAGLEAEIHTLRSERDAARAALAGIATLSEERMPHRLVDIRQIALAAIAEKEK